VVILDSLDPQVHPDGKKPDYLNPQAEFIQGDVREKEMLKKALAGVETVFHEAGAVGVGQSMYQIEHYVDVNTMGTAKMLDFLVNEEHDVKKYVVAASMSSYGEGLYECEGCGVQNDVRLRTEKQMQENQWELLCPNCGKEMKPLPTPESKMQRSNSIYAISKKDQEEMALNVGRAYGLPVVALRYFNVFGPRQSLSNPYTGVAAIFMSRVKNNKAPVIYEDGLQTRDFISVKDIAEANIQAMKQKSADYQVFNVGKQDPVSIKQVAETIIELYGADLKPEIAFKFRKGDVRHCFADISKIKSKLDWEPKVSFKAGMQEIIEWSAHVQAEDKFEVASRELKEKGLV
jgi:dTDP-L-rhamnose 4-epimerase